MESFGIYVFRGQKVMLDSDLAELYGVETKQLKRQVRRNLERFPSEFMFELTEKEHQSLRSQIGSSKIARGGAERWYLPGYTERGWLGAGLGFCKQILRLVIV
ncbi:MULTISPECIES: ORF6N domain-containing protein [Sphingobacterium]|uniref:ORF6N domain-containing protein n=1 Tax=Sphingobacterium TaxID=28453 RepID=UPI0013D9B0B1|nr:MULTISPECIES: ORF6N domain-containing protein [unclassified Sphingobacterium]